MQNEPRMPTTTNEAPEKVDTVDLPIITGGQEAGQAATPPKQEQPKPVTTNEPGTAAPFRGR